VNDFFSLIRIKVVLSVILSATLGFVYGGQSFNKQYFLVVVGIFFLSSGCSVLNQIQEVKTDKVMERTKNRPIVKGAVSYSQAIILAALFIIIALIALYTINLTVFLLGVLTVVVYNLFYTPLKLKTYYSILIGAFIGSIPPLIGFLTLSNRLNYTIINIATIFYLWQIPHFWLITELYKSDYQKIKYPFLRDKLSKDSYNKIFTIWISAYVISIINLLILESNEYLLIIFLILIFILILIYMKNYYNNKRIYLYHNLFLGIITIILIIKKVILQSF
jgi:protoheme IX farnesyltransferase